MSFWIFLHNLNYSSFVDPCGLRCNLQLDVSLITLPRKKLSGTLRPSLAILVSLLEIRLVGNNVIDFLVILLNWSLYFVGFKR